MALQFSTTCRNDMLNQFDTVLGASGTLIICSGTIPANCGTAGGTTLCTITLNATAFASASAGAVVMNGLTLSGTAGATGTASFFRLLDGSSVCHMQGTVGTSGTDMIINNTSITNGQTVQVTGFTVTAPGA